MVWSKPTPDKFEVEMMPIFHEQVRHEAAEAIGGMGLVECRYNTSVAPFATPNVIAFLLSQRTS